jgi:hypothetical protein
MNRIDEYKDKMNWDIWEDIQRVEKNAEECCTNSSQRTNNVQSLKRYKKT